MLVQVLSEMSPLTCEPDSLMSIQLLAFYKSCNLSEVGRESRIRSQNTAYLVNGYWGRQSVNNVKNKCEYQFPLRRCRTSSLISFAHAHL